MGNNASATGDLALFYQAFNQGQRLMRTLLGSVGQIYSNMLFLENLFDFLSIEAQMSDPVQPASTPPALIITHRFTTAMQADIIHVMDVGQIIESGTHQELLALGGRYAESWRAQMNGKLIGTPHERQLI